MYVNGVSSCADIVKKISNRYILVGKRLLLIEGFTMGKINDFILEELSGSIEKESQLKAQIRSLQLDMEFVDKARRKIIQQKDTTGDTFLSVDNSDSFDNREILELSEQRDRIKALIENKEKELEEIGKRCDRIKELLLTADDSQEKNNLGSNIEWWEISSAEINIQEMDRRRIAMEIHDTVVQNLTALTLKNDFIIKIINSDRQRAQLELKNCNNILKESIDELRNIIFDLRPMSLDVLGFEDAFINYINKLSAKTDMIITYDYRADINDMDSILLINLIRIIQELCNNSIKHSKGTKLQVSVVSDEQYITVDVIDNGVGFDSDSRKNGFGLSMIRDRLSIYGGQFETKRLDKGMQCRVLVPIKEKKVD